MLYNNGINKYIILETFMKPDIKNYKTAHIQNGIKIITQIDINKTIKLSSSLVRNREPILIHDSFNETPQRFVNCLNYKSYVRPHMHTLENQWELMSWVSGEIIAIFFDNTGIITNKLTMNDLNVKIIEIPPLQYHAFVTPSQGAYLEVRNCASIIQILTAYTHHGHQLKMIF